MDFNDFRVKSESNDQSCSIETAFLPGQRAISSRIFSWTSGCIESNSSVLMNVPTAPSLGARSPSTMVSTNSSKVISGCRSRAKMAAIQLSGSLPLIARCWYLSMIYWRKSECVDLVLLWEWLEVGIKPSATHFFQHGSELYFEGTNATAKCVGEEEERSRKISSCENETCFDRMTFDFFRSLVEFLIKTEDAAPHVDELFADLFGQTNVQRSSDKIGKWEIKTVWENQKTKKYKRTTENIDSTKSELNAMRRSVDGNTRWCHRCSDASFRLDANIHKINRRSLSDNPEEQVNRRVSSHCSTPMFVRRASVGTVLRSSTRRTATTNNETKSPTKSLQRNKYPNGSSRCSEREKKKSTIFLSARFSRRRFTVNASGAIQRNGINCP